MLIVTNPFMVVAIRCEWSSIKHQLRTTSDILQCRMMSLNHIGYERNKKRYCEQPITQEPTASDERTNNYGLTKQHQVNFFRIR